VQQPGNGELDHSALYLLYAPEAAAKPG
jgi:hypothetical protein